MPKYYEFKIAGYYLYFTSYCVIECMHVHASDPDLPRPVPQSFLSGTMAILSCRSAAS